MYRAMQVNLKPLTKEILPHALNLSLFIMIVFLITIPGTDRTFIKSTLLDDTHAHFVFSFLAATAAYNFLLGIRNLAALTILTGLVLLFSALEALQYLIPDREPEFTDLVSNLAGVTCGVIATTWLRNYTNENTYSLITTASIGIVLFAIIVYFAFFSDEYNETNKEKAMASNCFRVPVETVALELTSFSFPEKCSEAIHDTRFLSFNGGFYSSLKTVGSGYAVERYDTDVAGISGGAVSGSLTGMLKHVEVNHPILLTATIRLSSLNENAPLRPTGFIAVLADIKNKKTYLTISNREGLITSNTWSNRPEPAASLSLNAHESKQRLRVAIKLHQEVMTLSVGDNYTATTPVPGKLEIKEDTDLRLIIGNHFSGNRPFAGQLLRLELAIGQ